jgi:two-component sensor histidine kinase
MFKLLFLTTLFSINLRTNAQLNKDQPPSVLIAALQKNIPDTIRLEHLLQLALGYYFERDDSKKNLDTVLILLRQAEKLGLESHTIKWQPEILSFLGKYHYKTGNIQVANEYFIKTTDYVNKLGSLNRQIERWRELAFNIEELDTIGLTRINCFEKMRSLYHLLNNKRDEIEVDKEIADTHMKQGKLDLAESELLQVLAEFKAIGFQNLHYTYNLLSVTNHLKGNYNTALYYALLTIESMQRAKDTANPAYVIIFYSVPAHLYDQLGHPDKSIEYYRMIFATRPPDPFDFYMYREAGNFVRALLKQNRKDEALTFLVGLSKKHPPGDQYGKASLAETFAFYYNAIQNFVMADKYTRIMISLEESLGRNNEIRGDVSFDIGQYYFTKNDFKRAADHFNIALSEAILNNSVHTKKDIQLMLFKTDSSVGNYNSAIQHLNQYRQLNDSMFNATKSKQIEELTVKYETEKIENNIRRLREEAKVQQNEIAHGKYTLNWTLGGTAMLLIISGLLFHNGRLRQRANKKLRSQRMEIEEQNITLRHLVTEKDWLLKEIHHRVKNNLQIVMSLLNSQSAYIDNDAALTAINDSQHRVQAMSLIHQKLYGSENVSFIDISFYIRELVSYLADSFCTGQRIRFELDIEHVEMDVSQAVPLGLILNEAITNSIKYAFPDDRSGIIAISFSHIDSHLCQLRISDNGVGIPQGVSNKKNGSLGMSLIAGLSEDLDGDLSITNNNGTIIEMSFMYDPGVRRHAVVNTSFVPNN